MYLIVIHVPIYHRADRLWVTGDWKRSLMLLRDSFDGRFGSIQVVAPSKPADRAPDEQMLESVSTLDDIAFDPSFDVGVRARHYWLKHRRRWMRQVAGWVDRADVVHGGFADPSRPVMHDGLKVAFSRGKPTVAYRDTDTVRQLWDGARGGSKRDRLRCRARCALFDSMARHVAGNVTLLMLKGRGLMRRYGRYARRARCFHNTNYMRAEMAPRDLVDARVRTLTETRPVRLVYCGRLVERKGLLEGMRWLKAALERGADYTLDIIGTGPEKAVLERAVWTQGLHDRVRLLGSRTYGSQLIRELAAYDAFYFTPPIEDTPRAVFDGYAAGLPIIGTDIDYLVERSEEEGAAVLIPREDAEAAVIRLVELDRARSRLAAMASAAYAAGEYHAADNWYRRRAAWTIEAVEEAGAQARCGPPVERGESGALGRG